MSEMAQDEWSRLDKVRAELICSICLDLLTEPRQLDCDHSFCQKCLQNYMEERARPKNGPSVQANLGGSEQQPTAQLVCPCCHKETPLPEEGVLGLKLNFKLKSLVDILSEEEREKTVQALGKQHQIKCHKQCTQHEEDCVSFCRDCNELVCHTCLSDHHREHSWSNYAHILHKHKEKLRDYIHPVYEAAARAQNGMQQMDRSKSAVIENEGSVKGRVEEYFGQLMAALEQRKRRLLSMVDRYTECKLDMLKHHYSDLQSSHSSLLQHLEQTEKKMEEDDVSLLTGIGKTKQMLSLHRDNIRQALSSSDSTDFVDVINLKEESLPQQLDQLGHLVLYQKDPCSDVVSVVQEYVDTAGMESIHLDLARPVNYTQVDEDDYEVLMAPLQPETASQHTYVNVGGSLFPTPFSKDEMEVPGKQSIEPPPIFQEDIVNHPPLHRAQRTRSRLSLVFPQSMSSSKPDYMKPLQVIKLHNNVVHPCGIACTNTYGNLFITDTNNDCLHMLHEGKIMHSFEGKKFKKPVAVAISSDNYAYLLEQENPTTVFHKLTLDGQVVFAVHKRSHKGPLKPWGIAVSEEGKVYVSDWMKSQIYVYNAKSGKKIRSFKGCTRWKRREEYLEFRRPAGIAIDRGGRLMVIDRGEKCVWCINTDGDELIKKLGEDHLQNPYGIGVTKDGRVVVTESESDCVSVFGEDGELLQYFGGSGSNEGQFCRPHHVFVDDSDRIFVADKENRRIQIFQLPECALHETVLDS